LWEVLCSVEEETAFGLLVGLFACWDLTWIQIDFSRLAPPQVFSKLVSFSLFFWFWETCVGNWDKFSPPIFSKKLSFCCCCRCYCCCLVSHVKRSAKTQKINKIKIKINSRKCVFATHQQTCLWRANLFGSKGRTQKSRHRPRPRQRGSFQHFLSRHQAKGGNKSWVGGKQTWVWSIGTVVATVWGVERDYGKIRLAHCSAIDFSYNLQFHRYHW
jgi:hypothetical protein